MSPHASNCITIFVGLVIVLLNLSNTTALGLYEICPSLRGTVLKNSSKLWNEDALVEKITQKLDDARSFCGADEKSSERFQTIINRSVCYTTIDEEYGIERVDPDNYFPMLSYNKPIKIHDQISTRFLEPSKDENKARVAYIILAHANYKALVRLLGAIYDENNVYLIHVDAKAKLLKSELLDYTRDFDNIAVMPSSFNISWGSIDMVYATLEALFTLLDAAKFDHVVNLSAQDYAICSQDEIGSFLKKQSKTNFDFAFWASEVHIQYRLQNVFIWNDKAATCQLPNTVVQTPIERVWSTSQWFVYNYAFVKFLRENPLSHRILAWLETSLIPDESYFGNVLMNSPFGVDRDRNNLHYATFTKNSLHPDTMTVDDFSHIANAQKTRICFARKFDAKEDSTVMDMLDDWRAQKQKKDYIENFWVSTKW